MLRRDFLRYTGIAAALASGRTRSSRASSIGYFMYPQAETARGRVDSLNPDAFRYDIRVREPS